MMKKLSFVLGAAAGYVLGARAGRQRYEQIAQQARKVWQSEPVQQRVDQAGAAVGEAVKKSAPQLTSLASGGVEKVAKLVSSAGKANAERRGGAAGCTSAEAPTGTVENPAE